MFGFFVAYQRSSFFIPARIRKDVSHIGCHTATRINDGVFPREFVHRPIKHGVALDGHKRRVNISS